MPTATDPFTAAYMAVWGALRANITFMSLVRPGNQIDFSDGNRIQIKPTVQVADLPEVTLLQTAVSLSPYGSNSKVADASQTFSLVDVTSSLQVASANQVKWATLGALYYGNLENQTFNGSNYIRSWKITGGSDGVGGISLPGTDSARGVSRVSTILQITVNMYIDKASLPS